MGQRPPISSLSRVPLPYTITAEVDGNPWFPGVDTTFEGAYMTSPLDRPTEGDWVAGTLEVNSIGAVVGLVMVGPGSSRALAVGEWWEWARLTDPTTGVRPVIPVGSVVVQ